MDRAFTLTGDNPYVGGIAQAVRTVFRWLAAILLKNKQECPGRNGAQLLDAFFRSHHCTVAHELTEPCIRPRQVIPDPAVSDATFYECLAVHLTVRSTKIFEAGLC